jgi:hypothetical protein
MQEGGGGGDMEPAVEDKIRTPNLGSRLGDTQSRNEKGLQMMRESEIMDFV